jgi:uncharacterized repeat protein (TIGR01451 family)
MKYLQLIFSIVVLGIIVFLAATKAKADCVSTMYGGSCQTTGLLLDKQIKKADSNLYVDNLGPSDAKFIPGQEISFKLIVKNTGNKDLDKVTITDTLPNFLISADSKINNISFNIQNLKVGKAEERVIKTQVVAGEKLPVDKSLVCPTNWAQAVSGDLSDSDTASFCISNVSALPATGINPLIFLGFVIPAFLGLAIYKSNQN